MLQTDEDAAAIMGTNDDAFISKVSCMRKGYYSSSALSSLAENSGHTKYNRPPIINRGTFARVLIKRRIVDKFLASCNGNGQIISLGAGFDTLGFEMSTACRYVEVDLEPVVRRKIELAKHVLGRFEETEATDIRFSGVDVHGVEYHLRSCDILDAASLLTVLDGCMVNRSLPTLIIAEIVFIYLPPSQVDLLIHELSGHFLGGRSLLVIEHVLLGGKDVFGAMMMRNISSGQGCSLRGLSKYATAKSQIERYEKGGWGSVKVESMLGYYKRFLSESERRRLNAMELLDELEQFELLMRHYCVLLACEGGNNVLLQNDF